MRTRPISIALVSLTLALSSVACGSGISETGSAQSAAGSVAPVGQSAEGPVRLVAGALSQVPLRSEQRTEVESLISASSARHRALFEGRGKMTAALADQIEKGSVDKKALEPLAAEQKTKEDQALADDRAALTRLHAMLTPEQREKFVTAIQAEFRKGMGEHHGPGGKHGEGPRGDRPHDGPPPGDHAEGHHGGPGGPGMHGPMGLMGLGRDLNLDDDQKAKMKEIFKEEFAAGGHKGGDGAGPREHFAQMKEALESFKTPNFDAAKLLPNHPEMGGKFVDLASKIVPILKPEQRKIAADKLREHAKNPMMAPAAPPAAPPAAAPAAPAAPKAQ